MPKRGGGKPRNWRNDGDHFEHDDRAHSNHTRRVSFKPNTSKGKGKFRHFNDKNLLLDDDIDMGANAGGPGHMNHRKGGFRGRGGRLTPTPRRPGNLRRFTPGPLPWYQVVIPYGAKHPKDVILKALLGFISPEVFIPHYYKINGNAAVFYVDDVKVAEKLFHTDRKIVMSDGFKLAIVIRNTVPNVQIDEEMKEKMKLVMAKRYNATTKALDLTKFHADPDLLDIFCALYRPQIMLAAIDIMADNIPDLEALNLNDNKLHGIEHLKILANKLKSLKILYLGDNKIPYVGSLDSLKSLPLVELFLKGNPLVTRCSDHEIYVSDVRKKFPKLVRLLVDPTGAGGLLDRRNYEILLSASRSLALASAIGREIMKFRSFDDRCSPPGYAYHDGADLPPVIGFDVAEDSALPPRRQSFLVDEAGKDLVRDFLTQYFAIYDSDSRQPLLDAYHEQAHMSMAASYLTYDGRSNSASTKLQNYIPNSRNIIRINDRDLRRRYLRTGKLQVVSFLSDLPKTSHDLLGFAVDLPVFTPNMIVLVMNGVFKETSVQGNPTRSFHRTFVIVPNANGGFCVMNDMLFITNTTKDQEDQAFSSGTPPAPAAAPAPAPAAAPADEHAALLNMLAQQTGMNQHWSMNCLQETGWDYQRALTIFNQLHSQGKIPPEAFVK